MLDKLLAQSYLAGDSKGRNRISGIELGLLPVAGDAPVDQLEADHLFFAFHLGGRVGDSFDELHFRQMVDHMLPTLRVHGLLAGRPQSEHYIYTRRLQAFHFHAPLAADVRLVAGFALVPSDKIRAFLICACLIVNGLRMFHLRSVPVSIPAEPTQPNEPADALPTLHLNGVWPVVGSRLNE